MFVWQLQCCFGRWFRILWVLFVSLPNLSNFSSMVQLKLLSNQTSTSKLMSVIVLLCHLCNDITRGTHSGLLGLVQAWIDHCVLHRDWLLY